MWKSVNLKSLLIGGMMAVLVMCAMGSWRGETTIVGPQIYHGRFTIVARDNSAIILDTATGEAWSQTSVKNEEFYAPKIMLFEPNDFDL